MTSRAAIIPDAEAADFAAREPGPAHIPDDELDRIVGCLRDPAAAKRMLGTLLRSTRITFGQARRQVRLRPELEDA